MNGTPRLRSAYPQTPGTTPARRQQNDAPASNPRPSSALKSLPKAPTTQPASSTPLIPFDVIDAPSQRLYIALFYGLLNAWRFYDYYNLVADDTESVWNFLKWSGFDAVFLFGLPIFQIPWLEWSSSATFILWSAHMAFNAMLMFRIGIPLHLWLAGLLRALHDDELGLMGSSVKPGHIIQNASLILGKQIINILPEGSAIINPTNDPFCIGGNTNVIQMPIQINQTNPVRIEIAYTDLENTRTELFTLSAKEIRKLRKQAEKSRKSVDPTAPVLMQYPVKKTGLYVLHRVIDETDLDVHTQNSKAFVVSCPQAELRSADSNKCRGEVSSVVLEVEGTPPLKVQYHRYVNGEQQTSSFQSIQPDDFVSPHGTHKQSALVLNGDDDLSWLQPRNILVPLTESLHYSGEWSYTIGEVQDALGNSISYAVPKDSADGSQPQLDSKRHQVFTVHERPKVKLNKCNYQSPLLVAKGKATDLPVQFSSSGKGPITGIAHTVEYLFSSEDDLTASGDHGSSPAVRKSKLENTQGRIQVFDSGLYTLKSVSTDFCEGEVLEPASCLLQNPPSPELSITTQDIFHKCASKAIGLRLDLDLIGTPPFEISYVEAKAGSPSTERTVSVGGLRGQIVLEPKDAGKYTYTFSRISDAHYKRIPLDHRYTQEVRPPASAYFTNPVSNLEACIDEPVDYTVRMQGEGPWTLEYELVHGGRRTKKKLEDIDTEEIKISTEALKSGGQYSLVLTSITDRLGCKEFLQESAKFTVRNERPKAYFGHIEGKRSVQILEGKKLQLPLRLTGKAPWTAYYRSLDEPDINRQITLRRENDVLEISKQGTYELLQVQDATCPGSIEESAKQFQVGWIARPALAIPENASMTRAHNRHVKTSICEGDEDSFDVMITGTPPYDVEYVENINPDRGPKSTAQKQIKAALGVANVRVDSAKAGLYEYKFEKLSDGNYVGSKSAIATVEQRVYPRPDASFEHPGKTYSYCAREEDGEEVIPIKLVGEPPFNIEVEIKSLSGRSRTPERVAVPNIPDNTHQLRIPHRVLQHGVSNVYIRKVRDNRGCQRRAGLDAKKVAISVHDAPTITPVESRKDYCVGERLSYTLSGTPPFQVFTTFNDKAHKAASSDTTFRRLAEAPGAFAITGISDNASSCKANIQLSATVHPMPTVRISKGRVTSVNLREGGETEIQFDFTGTPPFEVTYTRSTLGRVGQKSKVLETRVERTDDYSIKVKASEEGQYEAVAIKDKWCAFPRPGEGGLGRKGQKLLQN